MSEKRQKTTATLWLTASLMALGAIFWGYDIGILSTVYAAPGFQKALHNPSSSETGMITAIYYAGTWTSYVTIAGPLNSKLGRRWAGFVGVLILCVGAALQAGAIHLAMMVVGRIIAGFGTSAVATAVPLYLSEVAPAHLRGAFVQMNQVGIVAGISIAFWVGYGFSFWNTGEGVDLQWRLSIIMQFVPAIIFCALVPFVPESPRWLMEHDQPEAAVKALSKFRGTTNLADIQAEIDDIQANIEWHKRYSVTNTKVFWTNKALRSRLWRAWALQFLQQMSGATGIRYYLPENFLNAGASKSLSLLASGLDGTVQVVCTAAGMLLIDRIGRKISLATGALIMAVALLVNGALQTAYPGGTNTSANNTNIFFIFLFTLGYSISFGPTAWTYGSEIFPNHVRAKGVAISASGSSIGAIIVGQVWPVAVARIGARTFFIFFAINVFSVILVLAKFPETKNLTLEEIDFRFGHINIHGENEATPEEMLKEGDINHLEVGAIVKDSSEAHKV